MLDIYEDVEECYNQKISGLVCQDATLAAFQDFKTHSSAHYLFNSLGHIDHGFLEPKIHIEYKSLHLEY